MATMQEQEELSYEQSSSMQELVREQMYWDGQFCPDQAWILSDFDTWEPNPHYNGPPNPRHPDDYEEEV